MPTEYDANFEREKWQAEKSFREREIALREREQAAKEAELELKRRETTPSQWWSAPLIIASIAAFGTAMVALLNGYFAREVEAERAEQTRILEMIKTSDTEKAAANLQFLLDAGLVSDTSTSLKLKEFLKHRHAGSGPSLPAANGVAPPLGSLPNFLALPSLGSGATYTYSGIALPSRNITITVVSIESDPIGKEIFISMCARNDPKNCSSQQLGTGRSITMQTPADKEVTIVISNFASNPPVTVKLGIAYE